jgi:hypothetical protein
VLRHSSKITILKRLPRLADAEENARIKAFVDLLPLSFTIVRSRFSKDCTNVMPVLEWRATTRTRIQKGFGNHDAYAALLRIANALSCTGQKNWKAFRSE